MEIDPVRDVGAFERLRDTSVEARQAVGLAVTRAVLDAAREHAADLLQSLQPHLGRHVDLSI